MCRTKKCVHVRCKRSVLSIISIKMCGQLTMLSVLTSTVVCTYPPGKKYQFLSMKKERRKKKDYCNQQSTKWNLQCTILWRRRTKTSEKLHQVNLTLVHSLHHYNYHQYSSSWSGLYLIVCMCMCMCCQFAVWYNIAASSSSSAFPSYISGVSPFLGEIFAYGTVF